MKDRYIQFEDGRTLAVSNMTTDEVNSTLDMARDGLLQFTAGVDREAIVERLEIELVARGL